MKINPTDVATEGKNVYEVFFNTGRLRNRPVEPEFQPETNTGAQCQIEIEAWPEADEAEGYDKAIQETT